MGNVPPELRQPLYGHVADHVRDQIAEPANLEVAIRVACQLLDSDQVLSLREALRLLLRALDAEPGAEELISGTRPCGHDDYHDPHEWADRPHVWCPGIGYDEAAASAAGGAR